MTVKRMDNVLIVVDDLEAVKAFFIELGLELEGQTTVEGPSVGSLIGLGDVRATLAMLRTPDGQGIELDKFHTPNAVRFGPVDAPVNALGLRRIMFAVDDIDAVVARMRAHGAELIGQMQYEKSYRLAYIRGPEGIIVGLAEQGLRASSSGLPSNSAKGGRLARAHDNHRAGKHRGAQMSLLMPSSRLLASPISKSAGSQVC
jgi:catechol 2,3-dioxygenase-like lactoylglutathione lyase family enzyme